MRHSSASCFGCRHFLVTHDPAWPYACLYFAIRSRRLPVLEVEAASSAPCTAREDREPPDVDLCSEPRDTA